MDPEPEITLHYFVNVLMAKSSSGLPAYRGVVFYENFATPMRKIRKATPEETKDPCPKCGHTIVSVKGDHNVFKACIMLTCDYAEIVKAV